MSPQQKQDTQQHIQIDKMLNDLLDVLASLDGRVKRLELKNSIKKRPSYLKVVNNIEATLSDDIRIQQTQHSLELLNIAVSGISDRLKILEES